MKMKKFAALAAATVMSVSAIAATSAFGVFATTDAGVNNIVIKDSDTNRVYKARLIRSLIRHLQQILSSGAKALMAMLCLPA